jgi:hypothetical protein
MMKVILVLATLLLLTMGPLFLRWYSSQGTAEAANPVIKVGGTGIAASTNYAGYVWPSSPADEPATSEIYMILSEPTSNTTTVSLQTSPNGVTWFSHTAVPTLWSAIVTDTNAVTRVNVEGTAFRIVVTLLTTDTVTPTFYIVTH